MARPAGFEPATPGLGRGGSGVVSGVLGGIYAKEGVRAVGYRKAVLSCPMEWITGFRSPSPQEALVGPQTESIPSHRPYNPTNETQGSCE